MIGARPTGRALIIYPRFAGVPPTIVSGRPAAASWTGAAEAAQQRVARVRRSNRRDRSAGPDGVPLTSDARAPGPHSTIAAPAAPADPTAAPGQATEAWPRQRGPRIAIETACRSGDGDLPHCTPLASRGRALRALRAVRCTADHERRPHAKGTLRRRCDHRAPITRTREAYSALTIHEHEARSRPCGVANLVRLGIAGVATSGH
jgi:hypothetical protein